MPTRRRSILNHFNQEAFASSAEYSRGILGNLVAARCQVLADKEEISMLWWLQQVSWRDGGLADMTQHLFEATPALAYCHRYTDFFTDEEREEVVTDWMVEKFLKRALVDPETNPREEEKFPGLWAALIAWRLREREDARRRIVETSVTRQVFEELDFGLETRSFVLIEGREGIGKSQAARSWCGAHSGRAIYLRLESGTDEMTLYRSIARELGTSCSNTKKSGEMRSRIEDALHPGHLMLVVDEAHFLWPQSERSQRSAPKRIDWLRTALVDFNVPIALISTPQFFARQCERFRKAGWNSNQIQRRLTRTTLLPEALPTEDILAVTQRFFPKLPLREAKRVAGVSVLTLGYLSTVEHLRKRVDFLLTRRPGRTEESLVEEAVGEIAVQAGVPVQAPRKAAATPVHTARMSAAEPFSGRESAPVRLGILNAETSEVSAV